MSSSFQVTVFDFAKSDELDTSLFTALFEGRNINFNTVLRISIQYVYLVASLQLWRLQYG